MKVGAATLNLIRDFEGLRLDAYLCPAGTLTIGYGHTNAAGPPPVREGMRVTKEEAERILQDDVENVAREVRKRINVELNDNQFGALVSLAMNIGAAQFGGSTALRLVNESRFDEVPERIELWCKARHPVTREMVTLPGLVRRRAAECELWRTPC